LINNDLINASELLTQEGREHEVGKGLPTPVVDDESIDCHLNYPLSDFVESGRKRLSEDGTQDIGQRLNEKEKQFSET